VALSGTTVSQSAAWSGVSPGTYTVVVVCSSGSTAGSQAVIVSAGSAPTLSTTSRPLPTRPVPVQPAPARGVNGGLGGTVRDYGPLTLGIGAALVGAGAVTAAWCLRRRSKPTRP